MGTLELARHIAIGVFPSQTLVAVWHPSPHMGMLHIQCTTAHANTLQAVFATDCRAVHNAETTVKSK